MPYSKEDFERDIKDKHLIYDYDAHDEAGNPEKWRYEAWFQSEKRIVYAIHGGPMAGRKNFQEIHLQCIRPGELWQCSWLEETGTIVSWIWDIPNKRITTFAAFSKGHWSQSKEALGDKRNKEDFERFKNLSTVGGQLEKKMLTEQGNVIEQFTGPGDLEPVDESWPTL